MKKGYSVDNYIFYMEDDCIIVDNYNYKNKVLNLSVQYNKIKEFKDDSTIGVWKIKKLN